MTGYDLTYKRYGSHSILIEWPQKIDKLTLNDVLLFKKFLQNIYSKEKVYINSTYCSILISYSVAIENIYNEISTLKEYYKTPKSEFGSTTKLWKIPVCYNEVFGIDLKEIAIQNGLSESDIIGLHSSVIYTVYFIGFLPGFLYLGGLDEKLFSPRKSQPRLKVERGSVAIGGNQTGVYPSESPGGWNIIGNSPINFFDVNKEKPCFACAGDMIQFIPISLEEHIDTMILVESGVYQIEAEKT